MSKRSDFSRFLLIIISLIFQAMLAAANDTINTTQSIRDGETLVSSDGKFEMGFFSPGNSRNRYVGMWYSNLAVFACVWVANRDFPLTDTSGVLRVMNPGILVLVNGTNGTIIWSTNTSRPVQNPVAQLLDSGNLVVRDRNNNFIWQSFDYPTDTYLSGMNLGWNLETQKETYISSWRSNDDPGTGEYSFHLDPTGYPQLVVRRGQTILSRIGPWNGFLFSGPPRPREENTFNSTFVMDEKNVYYRRDLIDPSFIFRHTINQSGVSQRWTWVDRTRGWVLYFNLPADICDTYRLCGAYGRCSFGNFPTCGCLDRFVPRDRDGWDRLDWSSGCIRRANLSCHGDVFLRYSGIKLPDARNSWHNASMTLEECRAQCLSNCSCMAYTQLDIRRGTGCLIWYDDLVDIKTLSRDGQDVYIRMASSESDSRGKKRDILVVSLATVFGIVLTCLGLFLYIRKRKNDANMRKQGKYNSRSDGEASELPFFDLSVVLKATNNFSDENKLGEGGFGPVYKGMLDGEEIAVKRLSRESRQGLDELMNEIIFIAKLQHRNLVRLLGCCTQGDESMLVYEYMPNKSLDIVLFDQTKRVLLDWPKRFHIINGVARGLLYLHQDSRLRIIHRDLKASNILLDSDMNPKISDFGLARSFVGNETEAKTRRVVGTYGYMSPEYAIDGLFSVKSDVFSFGVLVLEIVSGKRNRGYSHGDQSLNLLGHAWTLYREGRSTELVDASLDHKIYSSEVVRTIQVGLLCVQRKPQDRPNMSSVVVMLANEGEIHEAKQPGFFTERDVIDGNEAAYSANEVTITMAEPR